MHIDAGVTDADLPEVASALTDAFADYPVTLSFTPESLAAMFAADDVVADACRLARDADGRLLGVGLAARRGELARVGAMGVVRDAHGRGVGRAVGEALLQALAETPATEVILEALTVNAPALALYERHLGFTRRRRLVGFTRPAGGEPIPPSRWDEALAAGDEPDSWQLTRAVTRAREQDDLTSVPAVVPERHAVAQLLRDAGFQTAEIDQYELGRPL